VVVADDGRASLDEYLEQIEQSTGIRRKKWVRAKAQPTSCLHYLDQLVTEHFKHRIYYEGYADVGTGSYESLTVLAIAKAINVYREKRAIGDEYKVSVIIDGLKKSEEGRVGRELRILGIRSRKIRGARDQNEALLRLADRMAGLARDARDNTNSYARAMHTLEIKKILNKL
jgi:hypothetical protein